MYYVGIDIAKDKHDCCIVNERGDIVVQTFRIKNSLDGFINLVQRINNLSSDRAKFAIGLEDTGHYSGNLVNYFSNLFEVYTINPLLTSKQKKAVTLRKTKTDKIDAVQIAKMLRNGDGFRLATSISYNSEELKSLTRYRKVLVKNRAKEKTSVKRLVNILFPEYERFFQDIHCHTSCTALYAYPGKDYFAKCHVAKLSRVLQSASRGYYGEDLALRLRQAAINSIGRSSEAKAYELKCTIKRIGNLDAEIAALDKKIHKILALYNPPIATIPGIGSTLAASIIGEIGNFSRFSNPDKILAMAGMSPTTYQSGKYINSRAKMEKRGSGNLRSTLFLATRTVCLSIPEFSEYLHKKQMEGKHYFVAISHTAKKLIRLMYALETEHRSYEPNPIR